MFGKFCTTLVQSKICRENSSCNSDYFGLCQISENLTTNVRVTEITHKISLLLGCGLASVGKW